MNPISNNPFRILGLSITAGEREIVKQINTLSTYATMGKMKTVDTDFPFLPFANRSLHTIEEAKKLIEQNESKLFYSLFWFWENNSVDELAFEVLKEGNTNKAIGIWEKSVFAKKDKVYKPVILFDDLIRQSASWPEKDIEDHILKKDEDEYIIERKKDSNYSIPTILVDFNYEDNWIIECDTHWLAGVDNIGYGIVFGRDNSSFYTFQISGNGQCTYGKFINWDYTLLMAWKEEDAINKCGSNRISIEKIKDILNFRINERLVHSHEYEPFFGKYFGFKVSNNQKISFRNFKFCKLVEDGSYGEGINVSSKNFSCIKNLSNLYLSLSTNNGSLQLDNFIKGIALARSIFTSNYIEDYSKVIAGERHIYSIERTIYFYINDIVDSLKNYLDKTGGISTSQLINAFSSFPIEAKQVLNNRFVSKQIQNIDKEIEIAQIERNKSAAIAAEIGKKLISNTKADISYLRDVLGENDFQYQIIADKLSDAIVRCGIELFNTTKSDEIYLHEYEYALIVAVTQRAKERVQENLDSCKDWIANKHLYSCWFCGTKLPEESSLFSITIYKENSRTYFPRRVQYSYLPVNIPRCRDCYNVHTQSSAKYRYIVIGCAIAGIIIGAIADGYWFAGLLIGGVAGWIIGATLESQQFSKAVIKGTHHSTIRNYPVLVKMLKEGWQFSKPTA
ncbi:MAG: hypothetical protein P4L79_17465 [Legionella sp.]|uniref:hypothetical protein n=1 Tax=Legionella sp. TaxID=459 RepID=UPI00284C18E9|nr:hypothetical protein [Legionella sp.]